MINLNSQRKQWDIELGYDFCSVFESSSLPVVLTNLAKDGFTYYAIVHDKDKHEDGTPKHKHIHLVLSNIKLTRAKQIINLLSDLFGCNNENVQMLECKNYVARVQYLIHKNNPEKYQYDESEIITNDSFINFNNIMSAKVQTETITTEYIIAISCDPGTSVRDVLRAIGIGNFNCYFNTIKTLFECSGKQWR